VEPHDFGFLSGLDLDKMNQLAGDLEAAAAAQSVRTLGAANDAGCVRYESLRESK